MKKKWCWKSYIQKKNVYNKERYEQNKEEILKYRRERYRTIYKKDLSIKVSTGTFTLYFDWNIFIYYIYFIMLLFLLCCYYIIIVIIYYFNKGRKSKRTEVVRGTEAGRRDGRDAFSNNILRIEKNNSN